jgi:hypothetical protein
MKYYPHYTANTACDPEETKKNAGKENVMGKITA